MHGRGPNRRGTQKANDSYTKYLTKKQKPRSTQKWKNDRPKWKNAGPPKKQKWEMKCLRLKWKGGEVKDDDVGRRGAWDESSCTVGRWW